MLRRTTPPKKGGADRLLDATVHLARRAGLIGPRRGTAAIDSTGLETRHVSRYYTRRCHRHKGHYKRRYPKLSAVLDVGSHVFLAAVIDRGPKPDDLEFHRAARQAHRRHLFDTLLADAGYDAEHHHAFLHHELCVRGIIPPRRGRPPNAPTTVMRGRFRQRLKAHWPAAEYGQRWQIETGFSMFKRRLGSALRSRRRHAIDRETLLRVLAINLRIFCALLLCFQQSSSVPLFPSFPSY